MRSYSENDTSSLVMSSINQSDSWNEPNSSAAGNPDNSVGLAEEIIQTTGITLGLLSIFLNILFLLGTRYLKDKSSAYVRFMKNLSFADAMASFSFLLVTTWPQWIFGNIEHSTGFMLTQVLPYVFRSWPWMFFTAYLLTLSCLSFNQYVGVCKPWRYSEMITRRRVSLSLLVVWLLAFLQILIPLAVILILAEHNDVDQAMELLYRVSTIEIQIWMAIFALSIVVNIILNILIYLKIRKLKLKRRYIQSSNNPDSANIRTKQEAFITVVLLLIASIFCRLPFPLTAIVNINLQSRIVDAGLVFLLYLNFFVDPIICVLRMRDVRVTYWKLLSCCFPYCFRKAEPRIRHSISLRGISMKTELSQQMNLDNSSVKSELNPTEL